MGRPVGGAGAAGCGVFGLGALLISVALVFWLGSKALPGDDPSTKRSDDPGGSSLAVDLDELDDLSDVAELSERSDLSGLGTEPVGAALTVAPATGFDDGTELTITGSDLAPGPIELTLCLAKAASTTSVGGCDEATTVTATVDAEGAFTVTSPARRVLTIGGTAYDCAARAEACALFGHRKDNLMDTGTVATLTFAAGLPPVDAIAPPAS